MTGEIFGEFICDICGRRVLSPLEENWDGVQWEPPPFGWKRFDKNDLNYHYKCPTCAEKPEK